MDAKNKKIIFIPGWLHSIRFYGKDRGVEIWTKNFGVKKRIDANILIGHSLGANFALVNFYHNRNFEKIILVNPVLGKNNLWRMLTDWMKHALAEGAEPDKLEVLLKVFSSVKKIIKLSAINYEKIIAEIPPEKIVVLHGCGDKFLCDRHSVEIFLKNKIKIVEVKSGGHNWSQVFDQEIEKILNN